jgi:predicted kinase
MEKQLIVLMGLAGSGKSTYVDMFLRNDHQVLCADDVRLALGSSYNLKTEPVVYMILDVHCRALMIRGLPIVIDATSCQEYVVKKYKNLADEYGYKITGVHIDTPCYLCIERRDGIIPATKIRDQESDLDNLLEVKDKYFDEIITIKGDS